MHSEESLLQVSESMSGGEGVEKVWKRRLRTAGGRWVSKGKRIEGRKRSECRKCRNRRGLRNLGIF